jgi:crotonobetainyl-CoA:carnitine CoA-transferase CaiB-like acyl-CoA transferase
VFPTAGNDCWLAVTVRDESQLEKLAGVTGGSDEDSLRTWLATRNHLSAADALQAVGIAAAPVMANWELFADNHLNDRGAYVPVRHAVAGTRMFPGHAWRFEKTPAAVYRAAPMFAEHNVEVFAELLGLDEPAVRALAAEGVIGFEPMYAAGPAL